MEGMDLNSPAEAPGPAGTRCYEPDGLEQLPASSGTSVSETHDPELSAMLHVALGLDRGEVTSRTPPPAVHSTAADSSQVCNKECEGSDDQNSLEEDNGAEQSGEAVTELVPGSDDLPESPDLPEQQQQGQETEQELQQHLPQQQQEEELIQQQEAVSHHEQQAAQPLVLTVKGYIEVLNPQGVWQRVPIIDLEEALEEQQQQQQHLPGPDAGNGSSSRKRNLAEAGGGAAADDIAAKVSRLYSRAMTSLMYGIKLVDANGNACVQQAPCWTESTAMPAQLGLYGAPAGAALELVPEDERLQQQGQFQQQNQLQQQQQQQDQQQQHWLLDVDQMEVDIDGEQAEMPEEQQEQQQ